MEMTDVHGTSGNLCDNPGCPMGPVAPDRVSPWSSTRNKNSSGGLFAYKTANASKLLKTTLVLCIP